MGREKERHGKAGGIWLRTEREGRKNVRE